MKFVGRSRKARIGIYQNRSCGATIYIEERWSEDWGRSLSRAPFPPNGESFSPSFQPPRSDVRFAFPPGKRKEMRNEFHQGSKGMGLSSGNTVYLHFNQRP